MLHGLSSLKYETSNILKAEAFNYTSVNHAKQINRSRCCLGCRLGETRNYYMGRYNLTTKAQSFREKAFWGHAACFKITLDGLVASFQLCDYQLLTAKQ